MISYPRLASLALPPVALALGLFAYMNARIPDCPPLAPPEPVAPPAPTNAVATKTAFDNIYANTTWGANATGEGTSGSGSTLEATVVYRAYLQQFMKDHDIHSVVDAGCGDWEFSQALDWTGIDYKGYDIVESVIAHDKKMFAKPNIQFFVGNIIEDDLPPADLLISKHVLQHLPNADVQKFLDKQLPKYKHVLLVNGVHPVAMTAKNLDIKPGEYRELDVTRPPFNVIALRPLSWFASHHMHQVTHIDNTRPKQ